MSVTKKKSKSSTLKPLKVYGVNRFYLNGKAVAEAMKELPKLLIRQELGEPINPLESLGVTVLQVLREYYGDLP